MNFFENPNEDGIYMRLPREWAECYSTSLRESIPKTLPQDGIDEAQWPGRFEYKTKADYDTHDWEPKDSHSWLNLDENYKTKTYVDAILK